MRTVREQLRAVYLHGTDMMSGGYVRPCRWLGIETAVDQLAGKFARSKVDDGGGDSRYQAIAEDFFDIIGRSVCNQVPSVLLPSTDGTM